MTTTDEPVTQTRTNKEGGSWFGSFLGILALVLVIKISDYTEPILERALAPYWLGAVVCFGLLIGGVVLYWIRSRYRFSYGMLEIGFALASGWRWFSDSEKRGNYDLFAAGGVLYLIVRGLDNCQQGIKQPQRSVIRKIGLKPKVMPKSKLSNLITQD